MNRRDFMRNTAIAMTAAGIADVSAKTDEKLNVTARCQCMTVIWVRFKCAGGMKRQDC